MKKMIAVRVQPLTHRHLAALAALEATSQGELVDRLVEARWQAFRADDAARLASKQAAVA